jgi:RNA polymerase sigma-70 factor (ECF subfamily)
MGCQARLPQRESAGSSKTRRKSDPTLDEELVPSNLYAALRPHVAQIVRVLMGESPPNELVHDICVDVTLSKPRFRADCAFSTWAYAITNHHVRNWIRREHRHRKLIRAAEQASFSNRVLRPDEMVDMLGLVDQLRTGIATLTEVQRVCLILVRWECLSPQQVSLLLKITPTAVRMNVHRARARLRRWLRAGGQ